MSIWGSSEIAGTTDDDEYDGSVVSYINGWSNHYPGHFPPAKHPTRSPSNDLNEETPAAIGTAWIPPWCVPGHQDLAAGGLDVDTHVGEWLRLDVIARTVSIWAGVEIGNEDVHSVCLNEAAVIALRDNLNEWLAREKLKPVVGQED